MLCRCAALAREITLALHCSKMRRATIMRAPRPHVIKLKAVNLDRCKLLQSRHSNLRVRKGRTIHHR